jgi:WXG100 family type VII secretion target
MLAPPCRARARHGRVFIFSSTTGQGLIMANIQIGSDVFKVDLQQLQDAIGQISQDRDGISEDCADIATKFNALQGGWQGPAANSFEDLHVTLQNATTQMLDLLSDVISRMRTSYDNYESAETTNAQNLSTYPNA